MIKFPGGEIAFWSLLFIVFGGFVSYDSFTNGNPLMGGIIAVLPISCTLIWFDIRPAKWLVVAYLAIAVLGAILLMVAEGFSTYRALRGVCAAIAAFQFATWDGGPSSGASLAGEE